jgi:alanine dehydrogenase
MVIIGVPKEIKDGEARVSLVPAGARMLTQQGHRVLVEKGAGLGSGFTDEEYVAAGARIVPGADEVWSSAEMVMKVKEPLPSEFRHLSAGQVLFTYLHLAPLPELTKALLASEVTGVAYETIEDAQGNLPVLRPMSEVAGRLAVQVGASCLQAQQGGRGVLLSGVPGVRRGRVTILGAGVVGLSSARIARGMGAETVVMDVRVDRLVDVESMFDGTVQTQASNPHEVARAVAESDLVIGAVLVPGAQAPRVVTREMVKRMPPGSVIVDVAVDQGGCVETTRPTTHSQPTYVVDGVIHYCVANMPAAVPRTSTLALTNVTLPHALRLAGMGARDALRTDPGLLKGLNTYKGALTYRAVGEAQGLSTKDPATLL